jgi:DNA-directed RNA polymerase
VPADKPRDVARAPTVARVYARAMRTSASRCRALAEALKRRVSRDPEDDRCYTLPDDSVLVMIGNTDELLRACKEAYDAGIQSIERTVTVCWRCATCG